jgi:hypothetical protein
LGHGDSGVNSEEPLAGTQRREGNCAHGVVTEPALRRSMLYARSHAGEHGDAGRGVTGSLHPQTIRIVAYSQSDHQWRAAQMVRTKVRQWGGVVFIR